MGRRQELNQSPARPVDAVARSLRARLTLVPLSWVLIALGVSMLIRAQVGVAPYDVLNTGVSDTFDIAVGTAFLLDGGLFYIVGALLGGKLGWASVAGSFAISPMINLFVGAFGEPDRLAVRVPLFAVGILVLAVAVCLAIVTEFGAGPSEVFMLGLVARGMPVTAARWTTDGLVMGLGLLLGGALGVGTVVFLVAFGPLVARILRLLRYAPPVLHPAPG